MSAVTPHLPGGLTGLLVRWFVKDPYNLKSERVRARYGYLGGWVSCAVNLVLTGVKVSLGIWLGSRALIADGFHSGSDMVTSAIVIFGFYMASKPRDKEHPFGHANAELIAGLIMSIMLIVAGFELLRDAGMAIYHGEFQTLNASWVTYALVAATILFKEWLFAFSKGLGKLIESRALDADAWHHRMDSLTTMAVLFGMLGNQMGYPWLDPVVGLLVSAMVIWSGIEIAKDSISPLLGENVSTQTLREIVDLALTDEKVYNAHDIYVHKYGQEHFISLHVEILGSLTAMEMHDIAAQIQHNLQVRFGGACTVHVDPVDFKDARYQKVAGELRGLVKTHQELLEFHDLQFRDDEAGCRIFFEFSVDPQIEEDTYPKLQKLLESDLKGRLDAAEVHFTLEPGYNILH
ncbi:MAG: cation diffusion facilitator family transporter [bacterium]|nr:cation diffusion facilitator family transporter [bacterium]